MRRAVSFTVPASLSKADIYATVMVAMFCASAEALSDLESMTWGPADWKIAVMPAVFFSIAIGYWYFQPIIRTQAPQMFLYCGIWLLFPPFGVKFTFWANSLGLSLQDQMLSRADRAIGFRWNEWANFIIGHPPLQSVSFAIYGSHFIQPFIAVCIVAIAGIERRNANFVMAIIIALVITTAISAAMPALGPGYYYGIRTSADEALIALRSGHHMGLPYAGIVSFPSFHSAMAALFVMVYRGLPRLFYAALALNCIMLITVPYSGNHYLVDVIGGIGVAFFAQLSANAITEHSGNMTASISTISRSRRRFSGR